MREFNFFWGRFLLFKNFKPIILSFYILLSGLGYLFRKDIYEIWFTGLSKCFIVEGEGLSLFFTLYYFYFTSSSIFILYSPLLLLDKKYRNNGKIVLNVSLKRKKDLSKILLNTLLIVIFPIAGIIAIFLWLSFYYVWKLYFILMLLSSLIILIDLPVIFLYKILRKR
mgnify:CR=1 FL=1